MAAHVFVVLRTLLVYHELRSGTAGPDPTSDFLPMAMAILVAAPLMSFSVISAAWPTSPAPETTPAVVKDREIYRNR